ncbi:YqiA/YcfP family alpha/beta fold hydrolase [Streptobacillus moniliformis]|uniref:Peptidase S9 prolyl oligopeptidase catalytic domain-containing protein n=1 Tax=Streptobacillus moniliformis (strain ATCC 14647 / DSM 12112 / NCTC 10651 / 9901) TaxID=519441 RepID=D1AYW5_STRM9|nr:alpha/beta hydrolase [Streptobacillus moniliformis]ACZ01939.1 hypothetical protein Smon_1508 [Streptobacillus moniliformis DSM 12112]AVL42353.1 alpha/beta hydrolase [Streptobacillus moniliformis]SQA14935.1 Alpha/beta hydrolase family [Streptobacillus moniliformis]SQA14962.1 Alpha/beta hydrolase family [Streptobacillus moniliformis]
MINKFKNLIKYIEYHIIYFDKKKYIYLDETNMKLVFLSKKNNLKFSLTNAEFFYKQGQNYLYIISLNSNILLIKKINFHFKIQIKLYNLNRYYKERLEISNIFINENNELILFLEPINKYLIIGSKLRFKNKLFKKLISNKEYDFKYIDLVKRIYILKNENNNYESNLLDKLYYYIGIYNQIFIIVEKFIDYFIIKIIKLKKNIKSNKILGVISDILSFNNNIFIKYVFSGMTFCIHIDLLNLSEKLIINELKGKVNLYNFIDNKLIYKIDSLLFGEIIINKSSNYRNNIILRKYIYKDRIKIKEYYSENLKYISIFKDLNKEEEITLISCHGGPESFELLSNNYGGLYYKLLKEFPIKIIIFNYPGSISFGSEYRKLPYNDWKNVLNKSLNKLLEEDKTKKILIGGSFGGTVSLLIENSQIKNKILINPLLDLNNHIESIPTSYNKWFYKRFSNKDFRDINLNNILNLNLNKNLYFILGYNDEIINKRNILENSFQSKNFRFFWDEGTHNSNLKARSSRMFEIIKKIYKEGK